MTPSKPSEAPIFCDGPNGVDACLHTSDCPHCKPAHPGPEPSEAVEAKELSFREQLNEIVEKRLPTVAERVRMARQRIREVNGDQRYWARSIPPHGTDSDLLLSYVVDEYERVSLSRPLVDPELQACLKIIATTKKVKEHFGSREAEPWRAIDALEMRLQRLVLGVDGSAETGKPE